MGGRPFFYASANPQTLLIYAWMCCHDVLRNAVLLRMRNRTSGRWIEDEQIIQPFIEQEVQKVEADTLYGRLLRHQASLVNLGDVCRTLKESCGIYIQHEPDEQSIEGVQECITTKPETNIVLDAITADPHLANLLVHLSKTWEGDSGKGGELLLAFFLAHSQIVLRNKTNAFFLHEFIRLGLEQVAWSDVAATLLRIPIPASQRVTPLAASTIEDHPALQQALFQELLMTLHDEFDRWSLLSSPHIQEIAQFLKDFCAQSANHLLALGQKDEE